MSFGNETNRLDEEPSELEIRIFATRLLGVREYAVRELIARICKKWPKALEAEKVVGEMVSENLVSDERYAESFVRSRRKKFQGPIKIRAAMGSKGVGDAIIASALSDTDESWIDLAAQWLGRSGYVSSSIQQRAKFYRRLINRGFSHSQAMTGLAQVDAESRHSEL